MKKLRVNSRAFVKAAILVRSGLTLEKTARMAGVSVRTIKRYFRSNRSSFKYTSFSQLTKKLILYYTYQGWDFMMIATVLKIPPAKVLGFLDTIRTSDIKFSRCACGVAFPVTSDLSNRICPFCEKRRKQNKLQAL